MSNRRHWTSRGLRHPLWGIALCFSLSATALAEQEPIAPGSGSAADEMWRKIRLGEFKIEGDHGAVEALVLQGNIPITYEYVAQLLCTPNALGEGPACIVCHSSNDPRIPS